MDLVVFLLKDNALTWWCSLPELKANSAAAFSTSAMTWCKPDLSQQHAQDRLHMLAQAGSARSCLYAVNQLVLQLPDLSERTMLDGSFAASKHASQ